VLPIRINLPSRRLLAAFAVAMMGLALMSACGGDDSSSSTPTPAPASGGSGSSPAPTGTPVGSPAGTAGPAAICSAADAQKGTLTTLDFGQNDKTAYDPGEQIDITLTIGNCSDKALTLTYPTTQRYIFNIEDSAGNKVWTSGDNKVFEQVQGQETIPPNQTLVYTETWNQKDTSGAQVPDGQYKIEAFSVGCSAGQTSCQFGPVRFVAIGAVPTSSS
jgi:hypothetical protein